MIYKIVINLILFISIFIYGMENRFYFENIRYSLVIFFICIGLSLYIYYILRNENIRILILNIIYMMGVTYIYPPTILILGNMISEYILIGKYSKYYLIGTILIYILAIIRFGIDYNMVAMGIIGSILIYVIVNYEEKINILEKLNYDLKDKNYALEERRKLENKINYQSIELVKIEERNMISQKLHDKIGHTLSGSIMQLEASKIIFDKDSEKGKIMLDNIIDTLRSGMDDIRYTLKVIKPEQGEIGINNIKLMLDNFSNKTCKNTELNVEGDLSEINIIYWRAIIDCIREILTNSIKYSNGDLININITIMNKIIRVHIKDNGCYTGKIKKGMGLLGIEERIIKLNGDVYFNNEDGFSNLIILKR